MNPLVITSYMSIIGGTISTTAAFLTGGFNPFHSVFDAVIMCITGFLGFGGQMLLTKGMQLAQNAGSAAMMRCVALVPTPACSGTGTPAHEHGVAPLTAGKWTWCWRSCSKSS